MIHFNHNYIHHFKFNFDSSKLYFDKTKLYFDKVKFMHLNKSLQDKKYSKFRP